METQEEILKLLDEKKDIDYFKILEKSIINEEIIQLDDRVAILYKSEAMGLVKFIVKPNSNGESDILLRLTKLGKRFIDSKKERILL